MTRHSCSWDGLHVMPCQAQHSAGLAPNTPLSGPSSAGRVGDAITEHDRRTERIAEAEGRAAGLEVALQHEREMRRYFEERCRELEQLYLKIVRE